MSCRTDIQTIACWRRTIAQLITACGRGSRKKVMVITFDLPTAQVSYTSRAFRTKSLGDKRKLRLVLPVRFSDVLELCNRSSFADLWTVSLTKIAARATSLPRRDSPALTPLREAPSAWARETC